MTLRIRIASRKSNLAISQVEILKEHLSKDIDINIIEVVTSGDKISFCEFTIAIAVSSQLVSIPIIILQFLRLMQLPYLYNVRVKIELKCSNANINYYCKFLDLLYVY